MRLTGHHGHTTLVADGVAAIAVQGAGRFGLIKTAVRIVRFHGIAVLGADTVDLRDKQGLVVVAGEGGGAVVRRLGGIGKERR